MLYKQVEEQEKQRLGGGVATAIGTCRFCGQTASSKALEEWSQEEIDELTCELCGCAEAKAYAYKKRQKERAREKIELLFGKSNGEVIVPNAAVELLHAAVVPVCEGIINSITADIGDGVKGKISITSKGAIKVERTKTDKSTYEA